MTFYKFKNIFIHFFQRRKRGFDDSELWSLDITIAQFIVPRLERFIEIKSAGVPGPAFGSIKPAREDGNYSDEQHEKAQNKYDKELKEMLEGFKLVASEDCVFSEEDSAKIDKAYKLFHKYHRNLWY